MTEVSVIFIRGERGAACNNDAYSITTDDGRSLDILTVRERAGRSTATLIAAFQNALYHCGENAPVGEIRREAHLLLGIQTNEIAAPRRTPEIILACA